MMDSLRNASRNTMFERWLESAMQPPASSQAQGQAQAADEQAAAAQPAHAPQQPVRGAVSAAEQEQQELADFLPARDEPSSSSKDASNPTFRPGWEV